MSDTAIRRPRRRARMYAAVVGAALAVLVSACAAKPSTSSTSSSASTSVANVSDAQLKQVTVKILDPSINLSTIAPQIKTVFAAAATPLTAAQRQVLDKCLGSTVCETGHGDKTLAIIDDQVNTYYAMNDAETMAQAIQSGQIGKIIHYSSNINAVQYLSDFRSAIAQRVNIITSVFAALGNETGPVLAQAKAAHIAVVNGPDELIPSAAKYLAANIEVNLCSVWTNSVAALTQHLKQKGITHPTYALYSGPPGNVYAATWEPCAKQTFDKAGWTNVLTGWTGTWTPQGVTQAASALLASGKNPNVIFYDGAPDQILQAYEAAKKTLPTTVIIGGEDIGTFSTYQQALTGGFHPDMWTSPSQTWINRVAVVAGLEVADGQLPWGSTISFPMTETSFSAVADSVDLSENSLAFAGTLLAPQDVATALKH